MANKVSGYSGLIGWSVGLRDSWLDNPASKVNRYWRTIEYGSARSQWPWQGQGIAGLWSDVAEPRGGLHGFARTPFEGRDDQKFAPYFKSRGQEMLGPARAAISAYLGGGKGPNMERLKISYVTIYRRRWQKSDAWSQGGTGRATGSVQRFQRSPQSAAEERRARRALYHWYLTGATSPAQIPFVYGVIKRPVEPKDYYLRAQASFPFEVEQKLALEKAFNFALGSLSAKGRTPTEILRNAQAPELSGTGVAGKRKGRAKREVTLKGMSHYGPHDIAIASFNASVVSQDVIRAGGGRFGVFQTSVREANELVAMKFQRHVAALMVEGTTRPRTQALIEATLHEKNRYPRGRGPA